MKADIVINADTLQGLRDALMYLEEHLEESLTLEMTGYSNGSNWDVTMYPVEEAS